MRPLLKYRGGKSREIDDIVPHIPEYNGRYIEPFFGGGALFFHLEPEEAIINDINPRLMNFYLEVRNNYVPLMQELTSIGREYEENSRAYLELKRENPLERVLDNNERLYYGLRDMFNNRVEPAYSDAALYYFINKTAYSGMIRYNAQGEYNVPYGRYKNFNTEIITPLHSALLNRAQVLNVDYRDIFAMAGGDDFMFLDPPYDCVFSDYGNEQYRKGFGIEDHRELAENFRNLNCQALLVIGRTPLTEELYGDLVIAEYRKSYAINIRNRFRAAATHILVANYN